MSERHIIQVYVPTLAAGTGDEIEIDIPYEGTFQLIRAWVMPSTTAAANATNYSTYTLKNSAAGSTVGTAFTTATVALTKGSRRAWTLVNTYASLVGGTNYLEFVKAESGGGSVFDGCVFLEIEKLRA